MDVALSRPRPVARVPLLAGLALLATVLTGCSGSGSPVVGPAASASAGAASTAPGAVPAPSDPSAEPSADPTASPDSGPVLLLQGDGLGLLQGDASVEPLPFGGTAPDVLRAALEETLGAVAAVPVADCGPAPRDALEADGFRVLLQGDRFIGWTDRGGAERTLTTADGVGLGSRLDELQSAVPDVVLDSGPAGPVFSSPSGLSGSLDGLDPGSSVTGLSGGQTCPVG